MLGVVKMRSMTFFTAVLSLAAIVALSARFPAYSEAEDCYKAREVYESGTRLLNYEERRVAFQRAVDLCPSYADAHVNLADAFEHLARLKRDDIGEFNRLVEAAVEHYRTALRYRDNIFAAYLGLGDTYRVIGLYAKSKQAYERALALKPGYPAAVLGLGKIRAILAMEDDGFKTASRIVRHFKRSSSDEGEGGLMGFKDHTVVKDRLKFNNILFNEWSATLNRKEAIEQLREIGKALSSLELADADFLVEGHTDNRGGLERNMRLSWDRAASVRDYLVKHYRIDPARIAVQGFGYSRPRFPNDTPEHLLKNRRVELVFIRRRGNP